MAAALRAPCAALTRTQTVSQPRQQRAGVVAVRAQQVEAQGSSASAAVLEQPARQPSPAVHVIQPISRCVPPPPCGQPCRRRRRCQRERPQPLCPVSRRPWRARAGAICTAGCAAAACMHASQPLALQLVPMPAAARCARRWPEGIPPAMGGHFMPSGGAGEALAQRTRAGVHSLCCCRTALPPCARHRQPVPPGRHSIAHPARPLPPSPLPSRLAPQPRWPSPRAPASTSTP